MSRARLALVLAAGALVVPAAASAATLSATVPDQVIVAFEADVSDAEATAVVMRAGGTVIRELRLGGVYLTLSLPGQASTLESTLAASDGVRYAQPNHRYVVLDLPDDPLFNDLWGLHNTGQLHVRLEGEPGAGTPGVDIDAPEAWDRVAAAGVKASPVVAIADTGIELTHEDLRDNLWTNPGEIAGNGLDDDANGIADDVHGFDATEGDGDPDDVSTHGTHVAGTVAARAANGTGVAGVAGHPGRARLMALKLLDDRGYGESAWAVDAYVYAAEQGADVVNNSWGSVFLGEFSDPALVEAMGRLEQAGAVQVFAAGNNSAGRAIAPGFWAGAGSLRVLNHDHHGARHSSSNWGVRVELGAPGEDILSTRAGGYEVSAGTSMASPHVAGTAALILAVHPHLSPLDVADSILLGVTPDPALAGWTTTGGRLNAARALDVAAAR